MTNFESLKELFEFLKFVNAPKKHWTNSSGWGMARTMHNVILNKMKVVCSKTNLSPLVVMK